MLLVDVRQHLHSLRPGELFSPFVERHFGHREADIAAWLHSLPDGPVFRAALVEELSRSLGSPARIAWTGTLIDAAARVIAGGLVRVGTQVALPVRFVFNPDDGWSQPSHRLVDFPNSKAASVFLGFAWHDEANRQAAQAALQWRNAANIVASVRHELGLGAGSEFDQAGLRHATAALLERRVLALAPENPALQRFRLVWVEHVPARRPLPEAPPPPPPPASSPAETRDDVPSTIPDAPPD